MQLGTADGIILLNLAVLFLLAMRICLGSLWPLAVWVCGWDVVAVLTLVNHPSGGVSPSQRVLMLLGPGLLGVGWIWWSRALSQRAHLRANGRFRALQWRQVQGLTLFLAGAASVVAIVQPLFGLGVVAGVACWVFYVLRPEGREIRTHVGVEVRCSTAQAFAIVGDPRLGPLYIEGLEVDALTNGDIDVGFRYRTRYRLTDGFVFETEEEVLGYQAGKMIRERVIGEPAEATLWVTLAPAGARVTIDYESVLSLPQALLGLQGIVTARLIAARLEWWQRLKTLLEAPPGSTRSVEPAS